MTGPDTPNFDKISSLTGYGDTSKPTAAFDDGYGALKPGYDAIVGEAWRRRAAGNAASADALLHEQGIRPDNQADGK